MMWSGVFGVLAVVVMTEAWPNIYDNEFKRWSLSRRSYCKESYGKCFSTSDCCKGYVCAAVDEEGKGLNPTTPGWCVHEKELDPCVNDMDCAEGKCVTLGQHRYCVQSRPRAMALAGDVENLLGGYKAKGGLGADCDSDDDCNTYYKDGVTKLCCQKVRRGRSSPKKQCDRISAISRCITNGK